MQRGRPYQMRIGIIGINHKLADLKLREQLAKACQRRFGAGNALHGDHSFVLLSTCNRTEIYFASKSLPDSHSYILNILRNEVQEEFDHKLYSYFGIDCFSHLSRVTAGLDSAIVAETEIQGQVKAAYESTLPYIALPPDLHYLFQKSLKIGKQVRSQLQLGRGMPDLQHAVLQIGTQHFPEPQKARILFVGASEINLKILRFFLSKELKQITLCNRSQKTAEGLARDLKINTLLWEDFAAWQRFDWVIFGTKSPDLLLTSANLPSPCGNKKLLIDLCVPRNVDPSLAKDPHITLMNIDQINRTLSIRAQKMNHSLHQAEEIILTQTHRQVSLFHTRGAARGAAPRTPPKGQETLWTPV
jgi:glutamyl-tRNA reductase